jgi:oxysterol-binding protein-related protein 9/10/11
MDLADIIMFQEKNLLIDLDPLFPAQKTCPPPEAMLPNESRKMWESVTEAIHAKDFTRATQLKYEIEERQREKAAKRAEENIEWKPRFFEVSALAAGRPKLSAEGEKVLKGLHAGEYKLEPSNVTGA